MEQERRDQTKPDSILASSHEVLQYIKEGKYPPQSDRASMPLWWWISLILSILQKMDTHRHGARYVVTNGEGIAINCTGSILISILVRKQKKYR